MKLKSLLAATSLFVGGAAISNAASFTINNLGDLATDTLYQAAGGELLAGTIVEFGYFADGVTISSSTDIAANLGSFTSVFSLLTADTTSSLGSDVPGYAVSLDVNDVGSITGTNPLLGRTLYTLMGDGATLLASSVLGAMSNGTIQDDNPFAFSYVSNPGVGATIATPDTLAAGQWTGDLGFGGGELTYDTVQFVPEPSAALLGAFGVLGLLRRRRA